MKFSRVPGRIFPSANRPSRGPAVGLSRGINAGIMKSDYRRGLEPFQDQERRFTAAGRERNYERLWTWRDWPGRVGSGLPRGAKIEELLGRAYDHQRVKARHAQGQARAAHLAAPTRAEIRSAGRSTSRWRLVTLPNKPIV